MSFPLNFLDLAVTPDDLSENTGFKSTERLLIWVCFAFGQISVCLGRKKEFLDFGLKSLLFLCHFNSARGIVRLL